jgi:hypothetical protein
MDADLACPVPGDSISGLLVVRPLVRSCRRAGVCGVGRHEGLYVRPDKEGVRSRDALPREAWPTLGIVELIYTVKVIIPAAFRWHPALTWSLPAFWRSRAPCSSGCMSGTARFPPIIIIMSGARGMLLAFIAYAGREMIPSCALRYTVPK